MHMILRNIWARNWVPTLYQGQSILSRNFQMCVILKGLCIWASYLYMPRNFNMTGTGLELARCYQYLAASSPELVHYGWWVTHYLMLCQSISIVHCSNNECIFWAGCWCRPSDTAIGGSRSGAGPMLSASVWFLSGSGMLWCVDGKYL